MIGAIVRSSSAYFSFRWVADAGLVQRCCVEVLRFGEWRLTCARRLQARDFDESLRSLCSLEGSALRSVERLPGHRSWLAACKTLARHFCADL